MKNTSITLLLLLAFIRAFPQASSDAANARPNPVTKQEQLKTVKHIFDLTPFLWESMHLPHQERIQIDQNRKASFALGYYVFPQGGYNDIIEYVKVSIGVKSNGRVLTAETWGASLSEEQKKILNHADTGSDIGINIEFRHKDPYKKSLPVGNIKTGWTTVTIVPEIEAEFPGGYTGAATYVSQHVIKKMPGKEPQATVSFMVDETGKAGHAKLQSMPPDPKAEKLLIEAINHMPLWKPAKNSKGEKTKQVFHFQFGNGGC